MSRCETDSLLYMLQPLVKELGKELFSILIAHNAFISARSDYETMMQLSSRNFIERFQEWAEGAQTLGWGEFEIFEYDEAEKTASVRVTAPWEYSLQRLLPKDERWGCPFLIGKIAGIFSHALKTNCWAEVIEESEKDRVEFIIKPSDITIESKLHTIKQRVSENRQHALEVEVIQKTLALKESETLFRTIAESAHDAIIMMDNRGKISFWNKASQEVFGYTEKEALGKELHRFITPEQFRNRANAHLPEFFKSGKGNAVGKMLELEGLRKDGSLFPLELSISAVQIKKNWYAIGIVRDISERKANETRLANFAVELEKQVDAAVERNRQKDQALLQSSRHAAMGEMIGNIAHQWRQPLNTLNLTLQKLEIAYDAGKLDEHMLKRSLHKSEELIAQMSATIDDFRNFINPKRYKGNFTINESVESMKNIAGAMLGSLDIAFETDVDESFRVEGSPSELSQVMLNLVNNAKDALESTKPSLKRIKVYTKVVDDEYYAIVIHDNAGGIPDAILPKIFDPYFTTKLDSGGTGIGLYMSRQIIEEFGGSIEVSNEKNGAKFVIKLKKGEGSE